MPIRVTCPNCRRSFTFADAAAGQATACQACGTLLTIAPPAPTGGASSWGSAGAAPVGPAPQVPPGYGPVPTAGMPTAGMPYGAASYGSAPNYGGTPVPPQGMGPANPGQFGLPSGPGYPQAGPTAQSMGLPDLGLPPLAGGGGGLGGLGGLPSLPAAGMGRAPGPDPRFAQLPAAPIWYANPWVWTGGGLGLGALLGLAALVLTAPKPKVRRPAGTVAATSSPVPPPPGRGFERPGVRVPAPAGTDSATPPVDDASIDSVLGGAKEMPTPAPALTAQPTPAGTSGAAAPTPPAGIAGVETKPGPEDDPAEVAVPPEYRELLEPYRFTAPASAATFWSLKPDPGPYVPLVPPGPRSYELFIANVAPPLVSGGPRPLLLSTDGAFGQPVNVRVVSLPTGLDVAAYTIATGLRPAALGPDGRYLAVQGPVKGFQAGAGREFTVNRGEAAIHNGLTGETVGTLADSNLGAFPSEGRLRDNVPPYLFASPTRLIGPRAEGIAVWDLPKMEVAQVIRCKEPLFGVTPGGKYLLVQDDTELRIFDMETGKVVGQRPVPTGDFIHAQPTVSTDGRWISLVSKNNRDGVVRLMIYDFAGGALVLNRDLGKIHFFMKDREKGPEWLPGRVGLVFGNHVYEPEHEIFLRTLDQAPGDLAWALPSFHTANRDSKRVDHVLVTPLSFERIVRGGKIRTHAAKAQPPKLPELVKVESAGMKIISDKPVTERKIGTDPAPPETRRGFEKVVFEGNTYYLHAVEYAPAGEGLVVGQFFGRNKDRTGRVPQDRPPLSWLECYRPAGGRKAGTTELPAGLYLQAVTPTGSRLATLSGASRERLDVWEREPFSHVAGTVPHPTEKGGARVPQMRDTGPTVLNQEIRWAAFVTDDRLWTLAGNGILTLWQLPEFKALVRVPGTGFGALPAFSPNRLRLALPQAKRVLFLDGASGEVVGEWPNPTGGTWADRGAFSPDGKRFALLSRDRLRVLDLESGTDKPAVKLPRTATNLTWMRNADHLLLEYGDPDTWLEQSFPCGLYDLRRDAILWHYECPPWEVSTSVPWTDGRFRRVTQEAGDAIAAVLPDPVSEAAIKAAPHYETPLLTRGTAVHLELDCPEIPNLELIRAGFEKQLEGYGMKVDSKAPVRLRVALEATGNRNIFYRVVGPGVPPNRTVSAPYTWLRLNLDILDASGKILRRKQELLPEGPGEIRVDQVDQAGRLPFVLAAEYLKALVLPAEVYAQPMHGKDTLGFGTSLIGRRGVAIKPPEAP